MFNRIVLWANQFGMRPLKQNHMGDILISIHEKDFQQSQELKKEKTWYLTYPLGV